MKSVSLSVALTVLSLSAQAMYSPVAGIPSDLILVETSGPHRLLVFRACSPEHCWNDVFVQELSDGLTPKVTCSEPIAELNGSSDVIVSGASWRKGPPYTLDLTLLSSHGAFQRYSATLSLETGCKYQLQPAAPEAANRSFKPKPLRGSA